MGGNKGARVRDKTCGNKGKKEKKPSGIRDVEKAMVSQLERLRLGGIG